MKTPRNALRTAVAVAERAGALLLRNFRGKRRIRFKAGEGNLVTDMDHASEEMIVRAVRRAFPDHQIIAEERGADRTHSPYRWHIDPLDGTTNYAHRFPHWCISIALEGRVAVVYNPNVPELFTAEAGRGAKRNGKAIRVTRVAELRRAFLATGFAYHRAGKRRNVRHFGHFVQNARAIRRAGSAALDLAYVAGGVFDGFWELSLGSWDLAAGALLVQEAGGRVTDLKGNRFDLAKGEALATNKSIHAAMLRVLKKHD